MNLKEQKKQGFYKLQKDVKIWLSQTFKSSNCNWQIFGEDLRGTSRVFENYTCISKQDEIMLVTIIYSMRDDGGCDFYTYKHCTNF